MGFFYVLLASLKSILKSLLPSDNKQWKVFLACLTISTILWGLLKFSEEREDELQVLLKFENFPKNQILIGKLPESMPVKIRAQGFDLISRSFSFNQAQVVIDLSKSIVLEKGDNNQYVWLPKLNSKSIIAAIGANLKSSIYPVDSVNVLFSEIIEKELITSFKYKLLNPVDHYVLNQPLVSPYNVKVRGAKSVLNKMDTIYSELRVFDRLESDLDQDFNLEKPFGVDSLYEDSIRVFVGVETIAKYQFEIPILIKNAPDSLEVKLFPNEVKVSFSCRASKLTQITPNDFSAEVDFSEVKSSFKRLSIDLFKIPLNVSEVSIEPASVEYIIKSKD